MTLTMGMITIDCADPPKLASFWTRALGTEIDQDYGFFLTLKPPAQGGLVLGFQQVPEPRKGKNRVHIDFGTSDRKEEIARLVALGADEHETHELPGLTWTVLTDPEGNEFCVSSGLHG
ncbi:VOC family protein [Amycolatopsis sp. NPDC059027]|uniref:VOC family protein n=1 Tax=Amycolatopsis sp. NPDC059027 TaxID=3346709 RepID=UPI00366D4DFB